MKTASQWMADAELLGDKETLGVIKAGLRLAEDSNPTYRALSLILAQRARFEITSLLPPNTAQTEYQRGRTAAVFDLHDTIIGLAKQAKIE